MSEMTRIHVKSEFNSDHSFVYYANIIPRKGEMMWRDDRMYAVTKVIWEIEIINKISVLKEVIIETESV